MSSDFQTMPVRHVQSQQISSRRYPVLSQLSASGCPGMFHQHVLFHLPSFWELLACDGFGWAVAVMPDLWPPVFTFFLVIARDIQQRAGTVSLNFFLLVIIFKSENVTVFQLWIHGNCVYCLMCFRNPCYFSSLNTRKQACNASLKEACRGALWGS